MILNLINGSNRQQRWFMEAYAALDESYKFDRITWTVNVQWSPEPPCPGHSEFACTQTAATTATITIRDNLDNPDRDDTGVYTGEEFYKEVCAHELGHVVAAAKVTDIEATCNLFWYRSPPGAEPVRGTAAKWEAGEWPDRIAEGYAETFKDLFLPASMRKYTNRTNWLLDPSKVREFAELTGLNFEINEPDVTILRQTPLFPGPPEPGTAVMFIASPHFWSFTTGADLIIGGEEPDYGVVGWYQTGLLTNLELETLEVASVHGTIDLTMNVDHYAPEAVVYRDAYAADPEANLNPDTAQFVGWGPGAWMRWRREESSTFYEEGIGALDFRFGWYSLGEGGWLNGYHYHRNLMTSPGTPKVDADFAVPPSVTYGECRFMVQLAGSAAVPLGPGVLADYVTRTWDVSYVVPGGVQVVDQMPQLPTAGDGGPGGGTGDDGIISPDPPGTTRRGRPVGRGRALA